MQITAEQSALQAAVARVSSIVESRNTIPILSNLLIQVDRGEVWLTATDLDIEVRAKLDAVVSVSGGVTVPATLLNEIARNAPKGAEVTMSINDTRLQVAFGRSRYQLPILPASDFPTFSTPAEAVDLTIAAAELGTMLGRVHFAMSSDPTRYYINGAYLHTLAVEGRPTLRLVSTDGHRLAMDQAPTGEGEPIPGVIIPRKTVGEFRKLLDGRTGDVQLSVSPRGVVLRAGDTVLTSKAIDGSFPDYERVIPRDWSREIAIERAVLAAAVKRVALISQDKARSVKLALADGQLTLSVRNMEAGEAVEQIEVEDDGPSFETGFNARYILDALDQTSGPRVVLRLPDHAASPARLDPHPSDTSATGALCVLMPLRA